MMSERAVNQCIFSLGLSPDYNALAGAIPHSPEVRITRENLYEEMGVALKSYMVSCGGPVFFLGFAVNRQNRCSVCFFDYEDGCIKVTDPQPIAHVRKINCVAHFPYFMLIENPDGCFEFVTR